MSDQTHAIVPDEADDRARAEQLLPQVYEELRSLAAARLAQEKPGQTLQATALVHEAYLRLVRSDPSAQYSRTHFFAAAAEAMRRILVDSARRKMTEKRGGKLERCELDESLLGLISRPEEAIAVSDALDALAANDRLAADLVKLHYFGGFSLVESGELLGLPRPTVYRLWTYARVWLRAELGGDKDSK